ncbi:MAG TPA: hypothetical protein VFB31_19260 [Pseudolabrys sp.]|nr:hypothetical protein [Pseudolabrys sp.]
MSARTASLLLLSALAAAAAGCSPDKVPTVDSNTAPTSRYKDEIIDALKKNVFEKNDTLTVSNAMISDPALQPVGGEQHYAVCVRYTAHGTVYNITGSAERIGYFFAGHLNQLIEASEGQCAKAVYKPFPELNQVCLGKGCK